MHSIKSTALHYLITLIIKLNMSTNIAGFYLISFRIFIDLILIYLTR